MVLSKRFLVILFLLITIALEACSGIGDPPLLFTSPESPEPEATFWPTPTPERVLSICIGDEPASLFLYGDVSASATIIRQAIYDSPVDLVNFQQSSNLLDPIPSLMNGFVEVKQVVVSPGERIVDAEGELTLLASDVIFRPADCLSSDCWEVFENQESVLLDQVEITFNLRDDLIWSDGIALTPADSEFSYQVAGEIYGNSGPAKTRFTSSYEVTEDNEILWKGIPGYQGIYSYDDMFFAPLPQHLWSNLSREELLTAAQTTQLPIGWGPYRIIEWVRGDHITMIRNETYHQNPQGLPEFDALVFRFVEGGEQALAAYHAGECQIVINEPGLIEYQSEILTDQQAGLLKVHRIAGSAWEQLSFGISTIGSKSNLFNSLELRQVVSQCVDRKELVSSRLDAGEIGDDFYYPGDPRVGDQESPDTFQPVDAGIKLRELGWVDEDGDPSTARIAEGVSGVKDGTSLQVTLLAAGEGDIPFTLELIGQGLRNCGFEVDTQLLPVKDLLEFGPDGPVFGRNFDLAFFSWAVGHYQLCRLFTTAEIPGLYPDHPKGWGGVNPTGYSNQEFDSYCRNAYTNLPDSDLNLQAHQQMSLLFREEKPVLPLFFRNDLIIIDPELTGVEDGNYQPLWNIEEIR